MTMRRRAPERAVNEYRKEANSCAWTVAGFTLPDVIVLSSARRNSDRPPIPDHGDCPLELLDLSSGNLPQ